MVLVSFLEHTDPHTYTENMEALRYFEGRAHENLKFLSLRGKTHGT